MGICPILFNMLQFWLIDSIVKAKDTLSGFGTPIPRPVDDIEAPLFSNEQHDDDSDDENTPGAAHRRRRTSRDLERGVSPLNLSSSDPNYEGEGEPKHTKTGPSSKTGTSDAAQAGPSNNVAKLATRRSPPPSPAKRATGADPNEEDDWSGWDDPEWDSGEAAEPWSKDASKSPKAAPRRTSLSRTRSERSERASWGMDVINTSGAVR